MSASALALLTGCSVVWLWLAQAGGGWLARASLAQPSMHRRRRWPTASLCFPCACVMHQRHMHQPPLLPSLWQSPQRSKSHRPSAHKQRQVQHTPCTEGGRQSSAETQGELARVGDVPRRRSGGSLGCCGCSFARLPAAGQNRNRQNGTRAGAVRKGPLEAAYHKQLHPWTSVDLPLVGCHGSLAAAASVANFAARLFRCLFHSHTERDQSGVRNAI
jgi:hypothetical protein